jgi:hypothetical protein
VIFWAYTDHTHPKNGSVKASQKPCRTEPGRRGDAHQDVSFTRRLGGNFQSGLRRSANAVDNTGAVLGVRQRKMAIRKRHPPLGRRGRRGAEVSGNAGDEQRVFGGAAVVPVANARGAEDCEAAGPMDLSIERSNCNGRENFGCKSRVGNDLRGSAALRRRHAPKRT